MIIDGILLSNKGRSPSYGTAVLSFLSFLEKKLNVSIIQDLRKIPFGRSELMEGLALADLLKSRGVIESFGRMASLTDEPQIKRWWAVCNDVAKHRTSGATANNDIDALYATLAEALERYLWTESRNHFISPLRATTKSMLRYGPCVVPERFVGFSSTQRESDPKLRLEPDATYLWVRGTSHVTGRPTYVPAQTISGVRGLRTEKETTEPLIRLPITTGLATWPEKKQAILSGALEVIERDAYMITWLNQLSLPRIPLDELCAENQSLAELIRKCVRYKLKTHAIRLITDAPTHAVCVVIEDGSGVAPRFACGLKAHHSLTTAVEGATIEALRGRVAHRNFAASGKRWDAKTPVDMIGHVDRIYYWGIPENAKGLEFLIQGKEVKRQPEIWENDTPEEHFARIIEWCRTVGYECVSVPLGISKLNPTSWHVEVVVIPELQPTYLHEKLQQIGGSRLKTVPEQFGYESRKHPFIKAPHPFA